MIKFEHPAGLPFDKGAFERFIMWSYEKDASDIFLTTDYPLQLKLHGEMVSVSDFSLTVEEMSQVLRDIYVPSAPEKLSTGNAQSFGYSVMREEDDAVIRFRCEATGCNDSTSDKGISIVLRTIPELPPSVEELGVEQEIIDMLNNSFGLVLITGPTGSGKTTLLGSLIKRYATSNSKHVITYEAPIEFTLNGFENQKSTVVQTEVYKHLNGFSEAIANALRRAPNLILIGEARDKETIQGCVRAAETGHLVLSTTHTNSVAQTIPRMANEFAKEEASAKIASIVDSLRGIVHQRLMPKRGGGRVAVKEYLTFNEDIRTSISLQLANTDDVTNLVKGYVQSHGHPLLEDIKIKFSKGLIEFVDLVKSIHELGKPEDFEQIPKLIEKAAMEKSIDKATEDKWMDLYRKSKQ